MGILWAVYNGFRILMGAWTLALSRYMLPFMKNFMSRDTTPFPSPQMFHVIFLYVFIYAAAEGFLGVIAAVGLLKHAPWARIVALIAAFVSLISIPFGTAVGIYTLIVLLPAASERNYRRFSSQA